MAGGRKRTLSARLSGLTGKGRRGAGGKGKGSGKGKKATARPRRGRVLRWLTVCLIWLTFGFGLLLAWYTHDLPDTDSIGAQTRRASVTLVTTDDRIIATYGDLYGEPLTLGEVPRYLVDAVLATEDRRFYEHWGVDPWGVARALVANLWHGEIRQGGSTITQQLAKNLFLTHERTIKRKVQETILALWLERRFSKNEILTIYLNRAYFGAGTYGIDAAARKFFGKTARHVTLYEAAMLAGLLKAPSRYNPGNDPATAMARADQVLINMLDADFLDEADVARGRRVPFLIHPEARNAELYFADWALERVSEHVGYSDRDLVVVTTLDTRLQRLAQAEVETILAEEGATQKFGQAAMVVMSPNGAVRAVIGGRDYGQSQFNRATQALRQPGSAFKLFVYLAGLEAGFRPDSMLFDSPIRVGKWRPTNYTGTFRGQVSVREAVARSINTVAVTVSERVGRERVIEMARRLGITTPLSPKPSIALGSHEVRLVELTGAYAALANGGRPAPPFAIAEIRDRAGAVLYRKAAQERRALSPWTVGAMNDMLAASIAWGTGKRADIGRPAAGKTGTSQDWRDAWFVGYTPQLVAGVWVGNDDNTAMEKVTGGTVPARLWGNFMAKALEDVAPEALPGVGRDYGRGAPAVVDRRAPGDNGTEPAAQRAPRRTEAATAERPRRPAPAGGTNAAPQHRGPASTQGIFAR